MLDYNQFKKTVKEWIKENPEGTTVDLRDFCEDQIPPAQFAANEWLIDQTVAWYRHILNHRELVVDLGEESYD